MKPSLTALCDQLVEISKIPAPDMENDEQTTVDSLNVSVATGIIIHQFLSK